MSVMGTIRFLFGAALVAAGGALVAPLATNLAAAARTAPQLPPGSALGQPPVNRGADPVSVPSAPAPGFPQADLGVPPPADPWVGAADTAGGLQLDRCPPPPPAPLPPAPQELGLANPALGGAYRSTLHVPPPPLLDAQPPPPGDSWATAPPASAVPAVAVAPPAPAATHGELTVPSTYRIQDGDDLGTIAGRFYGQPAAASAIWAANRETIPNPDLLPIGAELRLPPPWAVGGQRRSVAGAIEPAAYARPVGPPPPGGTEPMRDAAPWLAPVTASSAPISPPNPAPQAAVATSVRVGPGETLATLARRLYGDPAMADAIFAVNRDRVRGPELVVPGMELRLPRPITTPRP